MIFYRKNNDILGRVAGEWVGAARRTGAVFGYLFLRLNVELRLQANRWERGAHPKPTERSQGAPLKKWPLPPIPFVEDSLRTSR